MSELPDIDSWKKGNEEDISLILNCYCINCETSEAQTTVLPTKIPMFREIIIMALFCPSCNFRNSEVTFGGEIQPKGIKYTLDCGNGKASVSSRRKDLNRSIVKSDSCTMLIPELEFEIPPNTQRGCISTLEGILTTAANNLDEGQSTRLKLGDVTNFHKCQHVIDKLRAFVSAKEDEEEDKEGNVFTLVMNDPAGNSFIENLCAPKVDPQLSLEHYNRSPSQDMSLGLQPSTKAVEEGFIDDSNPLHKNVVNASTGVEVDNNDNMSKQHKSLGREEVMKFPTDCPNCHKPAETDMCLTDIPHFKEIIIMALVCDHCGYKSNEIKGGGAIPQFGTCITVKVTTNDDLAREVLKSDTGGIAIPELDFELEEGGLDGVYTTVEGLLQKMHQRLVEANPFGSGDSSTKHHLYSKDDAEAPKDQVLPFSQPSLVVQNYQAFLSKLLQMSHGELLPFTLIISDPISNSFMGPIPKDAMALALQAEQEGNHNCYDTYVDPRMCIEEFERTFDMNEILGLNDIQTENYQEKNDEKTNYGTDQMELLPDRIRRVDIRGPDHPLEVGKGTMEGDTTVMGLGSTHFAVPSIAQRGINTGTRKVEDKSKHIQVMEEMKE